MCKNTASAVNGNVSTPGIPCQLKTGFHHIASVSLEGFCTTQQGPLFWLSPKQPCWSWITTTHNQNKVFLFP
ncbi:hypothetical protein Pelo_19225 [Pelomyxa schiedti]|nr:hypothetical protein Pelo_19225 [Pelomyxa schiedti]